MNERDDNQNSPPPAGGRVLGSIPAGPRDTTLGGLRTGATSVPDRPVVPPPPPLFSSADDQLRLPRGGWVAMRKSGGFKFSWREIFVYQDGRVKYVSSDRTSHVKMPAARLNDNQKFELRRTLAETQFPAASTNARHSPDTFAYELVARVGRKVYTAEVFEGSIPGSLAPLIQHLQRLMPSE